MKPITVGISGINAVDNPGPGVGVARSLRADEDLPVRIVGLAYDAMEPGIYMDWLMNRCYVMPYPSRGAGPYLERLLYIRDTYGLDYVIPCLDVELPLYAAFADDLAAEGIKTLTPTRDQFKLRGKDRLEELSCAIGLRTPRTKVVTSLEEMEQALDRIGYPAMIKGVFYKAHRALNPHQAVCAYNEIVAEWGYPVIVQEIVEGEELNVVGAGDGRGGCLGLMGLKKMWVTDLGKMWTGVSVKNQAMLAAARAFIRCSQWRGAFELECISSGGDIYLIEINPRLPAWSFFSTGLGINLPAGMVRSAMGLPVNPNRDYEAGKLYIRYTYEVISDSIPFQDMMTKGEHTHETDIRKTGLSQAS